MPGPRVVILYEDKTAGGLHELVSKMAKARRAEEGREPLAYLHGSAQKSNSKLIAECSSFDRMRFFGPHRADHVLAVIDAYEAENVVPSAPKPLGPPQRDDLDAFARYCQELDDSIRAHMRDLAFKGMTAEARTREEGRFHPCVLFWERESVFLAGADILRKSRGLVLPEGKTTPAGIQNTRCPTAVIEQAWLSRRGGPYKKQINGPELFRTLADVREEWPGLLDRMPSLREIVDTLVSV